MMNQGSILVLLQMVKKKATAILVAKQGEAEWPIVLSWMKKACRTLVQPLVMDSRQSCSLRGNLE